MKMKRILTIVAATAGITSGAALMEHTWQSPTYPDSPFKGEIYGMMTNNGDWEMTAPKRGLYLINPANGTAEAQILNNNFTQGQASVIVNGKLYVSNIQASGTSWAYSGDLKVFDIATGAMTDKVDYPAQSWENRCTAYAYNKATDEIWACVNGEKGAANGKQAFLATFNPATFEYTTIKQLSTAYNALAVDMSNNLYGTISGTSDIVRIEEDGSYSILATAPEIPRTNTPVALTYSPMDNCLVYIYQNSDEQTKMATVTIDPYNARYTEIFTMPERPQFSLVYASGAWAAADAPATISDLAIKYAAAGSLDAEVSFSVPAKAVDGSNLQGSYTATITIDGGENITIGNNFAPNAKVNYATTLTEGNHTIKVRLLGNNGASDGESAVIGTFAGFDTPTAVKNLTFKKNATGGLTLKWEAPEGQHGAVIGKPTYHIVVNGTDDYTTTGTQWTDNEIAPEMATYNYSIYAEAEGKIGPAIETGKIVLGTALETPFKSDFSTEAGLNFFTIINANGDKNASSGNDITWEYNRIYKYVSYHRPGNGMDPDGGDDYLVLPALKLKAGFVYAFLMNMKIGSNKPENLEVIVADGAFLTDMENGKIISENTEYTNRDYELKEILFSPEKDGDYNFAIHYCTPTENSIDVTIDKINVLSYGSALAPAAPTELKVVPEGSGSLNATIMFRAPKTDFNGNEISSLSSVTIYRDGEEIYSASGYKPGQLVSYEDEVPATDFYTYSVTASNEHGPGKDTSTNICVGATELPVQLDFSTEEGCSEAIVEDVTAADNQTFHFDTEKNALVYMPQLTGQVLDYFHTTYVYLHKGQMVNLKMNYSIFNPNATQDMSFAFMVKTASQKQTLYPWLVIRRDEDHCNAECTYTVPADGLYCFGAGFENYLNANNTGICIHSFEASLELNLDAPAAVVFKQVVPDSQGKLEATVEFNMPSAAIGGGNLDGDVTATIYNAINEQIGQVTGTPGQLISTTITTIHGLRYYTIVTSNTRGQGKAVSFGFFSGEDAPMRVTNLQVLPSDEDNMSAEISWDPPVDAEHVGAWFNADDVNYIVTVTNNNGEEIKKFDTDKRFVIFETENEQLINYTFSVVPYTSAGIGSQPLEGSTYLGKPLSIPFEEAFDGELTNNAWQFAGWHNGYDETFGQALIFDGGRGEATFPKLTFTGTNDVLLTFDIYHYQNSLGVVVMQVSSDDINWTTVPSSSIHTGTLADQINSTYGWENNVTVYLSNYRSYNWISLRFLADGSTFGIRNVRIAEKTVAIDGIESDSEADTTYYNLQGVRVAHPAPGNIYIVRQGNTTKKVLF